METLIIASMRQGAGKTSMTIGIAKALGKKFGYMKPFGERVLYRKKRLLDYDSNLITKIFEMNEMPEDISIGFDHSKLRFMFDENSIQKKLKEMESAIGSGKEVLLIETGKDLTYGSSVNLDPFSISKYLGARLVVIVSGEDDSIIDDVTFLKKYIQMSNVNFLGVLINKVMDVEDFKVTYLEKIEKMGIKVIGILPFEKELTFMSVEYVSDILFAKVLGGQEGIRNQVKQIFIGAMSGDSALKNPLFQREKKLIITSGDRNDMIIAALESDTAAIVLTNNIFPPSATIAEADRRKIPLLLVPGDTFHTAKTIDDMERLITVTDKEKIELLEKRVRTNVDLDMLFK